MRPRNAVAGVLWRIGHRLYVDPEQFLPKCPDCGIAPDYGPDEGCLVCSYRWEQQQIEEARDA